MCVLLICLWIVLALQEEWLPCNNPIPTLTDCGTRVLELELPVQKSG